MSSAPRSETLGDAGLLAFVTDQRWFATPRGTEPTAVALVDQGELRGVPPLLDVLVEVRFANGGRDVYQLLLRRVDPDEADRETIGATDLYPALGDAATARELLDLVGAAARVRAGDGEFEFCAFEGWAPGAVEGTTRRLGVEQTNSSVVVDEALVVKVYRRLETGVNPELELVRFLAAHGFEHVPELCGWWSYAGPALGATLGVVQRFLPGAVDGWKLVCDGLAGDSQLVAGRLARLGEVIGGMHRILASAPEDPVFAPEEASHETLALLAATVDDEIEEVFEHLPDDEALVPIAGCGGAVRDLLHGLGTVGTVGLLIRDHGDLHLGQALWAADDWFVVDFEGEPARPLTERRAKRSPLRDVAGMLRSITYAATVTGSDAPVEERLRSAFLDAYLAAIEPSGILPPPSQVERLIAVFELEKAVYELRYELAHRPEWVYVPVAGIRRLLEASAA